MQVKKILKFVISLAIPLCAGFIGSLFTAPVISTWYTELLKPSFNPPNSIFGPVWTALYILMGIGLYLVWTADYEAWRKKAAMMLFFAHLALNVAWSVIFFGMRSPFFALIEIVVLWCSIVIVIAVFWRIKKSAAMLLIPYILWVSFASILNFEIWRLNPIEKGAPTPVMAEIRPSNVPPDA